MKFHGVFQMISPKWLIDIYSRGRPTMQTAEDLANSSANAGEHRAAQLIRDAILGSQE